MINWNNFGKQLGAKWEHGTARYEVSRSLLCNVGCFGSELYVLHQQGTTTADKCLLCQQSKLYCGLWAARIECTELTIVMVNGEGDHHQVELHPARVNERGTARTTRVYWKYDYCCMICKRN